MKIPRAPHAWNPTPTRAVAVQRALAGLVRVEPIGALPRTVAGVDCAFAAQRGRRPAAVGSQCIAAAVLWDLEEARAVETVLARRPLRFPYVPGLLSFRELPTVIAALRHRGERVGTALRTRDDSRPVFVSVGHRIDLASAERLVLACGAGFRLPEPTRLADRAVAAAKRTGRPLS